MRNQRGFTLIELLIVIAVLGIALGMSALYLAPLGTPLEAGSSILEGFFRQARLSAIAQTSAYRVRAIDGDSVVAERAGSCSDTAWTDEGMNVELPTGVAMTDDTWSLCFSSRGISTDNIIVTLDHADYDPVNVEVLVGGTTQVFP